jgi:hypothetical protein
VTCPGKCGEKCSDAAAVAVVVVFLAVTDKSSPEYMCSAKKCDSNQRSDFFGM